jgi:hypothetical protein
VCGHRGRDGPDQHTFDATQATIANYQQPGPACLRRHHLARVADYQLPLYGESRLGIGRDRGGRRQASPSLREQHVPVVLVAGKDLEVGFGDPGERSASLAAPKPRLRRRPAPQRPAGHR